MAGGAVSADITPGGSLARAIAAHPAGKARAHGMQVVELAPAVREFEGGMDSVELVPAVKVLECQWCGALLRVGSPFVDSHVATHRPAVVPPPADMEPGRWWRAVYADGRVYPATSAVAGRRQIWAESSDEQEIRQAAARCPDAVVVQQLYSAPGHHEWRDAEPTTGD